MTTRLLPREEWPRLAGTELEAVWPILPPGAAVVVVEDGEEIVGCWAAYTLAHVEGIWIASAHRGRGSVLRRLLAKMARTLRDDFESSGAVTGAMTDDVRELLTKFGATKLPGDHYALPMGGRRMTCQQP